MIVKSIEEIEQIKETIYSNANRASEQICSMAVTLPSVAFLSKIKFNKAGFDPLSGSELNFIEQLNQTFSDFVVLECASRLLQEYPGKILNLNFGSASGFDVESDDGEVVAECFAVTSVASNKKLEKDCIKLMNKAPDKQKHIYFYSDSDSDTKLQLLFEKYPKIKFCRITAFNP